MARRKRAKPDPEQLPISFEAQAPEAQHDEAQHDEEQRGEEQRGEEQRVLAFQLRPGDRVTVARPRLGGGRSPGQLPGREDDPGPLPQRHQRDGRASLAGTCAGDGAARMTDEEPPPVQEDRQPPGGVLAGVNVRARRAPRQTGLMTSGVMRARGITGGREGGDGHLRTSSRDSTHGRGRIHALQRCGRSLDGRWRDHR